MSLVLILLQMTERPGFIRYTYFVCIEIHCMALHYSMLNNRLLLANIFPTQNKWDREPFNRQSCKDLDNLEYDNIDYWISTSKKYMVFIHFPLRSQFSTLDASTSSKDRDQPSPFNHCQAGFIQPSLDLSQKVWRGFKADRIRR